VAEKISKRVQKARIEFWDKIRDIRAEYLIFIDESGVNLAIVRLYVRSLKGKRAREKKPLKRGTNIYLISTLLRPKVVAFKNIYGAVNGITFEAFTTLGLTIRYNNRGDKKEKE